MLLAHRASRSSVFVFFYSQAILRSSTSDFGSTPRHKRFCLIIIFCVFLPRVPIAGVQERRPLHTCVFALQSVFGACRLLPPSLSPFGSGIFFSGRFLGRSPHPAGRRCPMVKNATYP